MKAVLRKNGHSTDFYRLVWPKAEIKEFAKPCILQAEAFCKILPLVGLNPNGILPNIIIPHNTWLLLDVQFPCRLFGVLFLPIPTLLATPPFNLAMNISGHSIDATQWAFVGLVGILNAW